jgi:excisionase family DNA binding protein
VPSNLMPLKTAARALGVHPDTVRRMIRRGELKAVRIGSGRGRVMIAEGELRRHLARAEGDGHSPQEAIRLVYEWFDVSGTHDPMVLLIWLANNTLDFRRRQPRIAAQEARIAYGPKADAILARVVSQSR